MKKGFTMIELIFVIVILGILASVAIPRLAATREDAEISAAVANLRTLVSDISAYHVAKGEFGTVKWKDITNLPLQMSKGQAVVNQTADTLVYLAAGGENCIGVQLVNRDGNKPAHIKFDTDVHAIGGGVCQQVANAAPVKAYLDSKVNYTDSGQSSKIDHAMVIGSTTRVYSK